MRVRSERVTGLRGWRPAAAVVAFIVVAAVALPVLAADPSAAPSASAQANPSRAPIVAPLATPQRSAPSAGPEAPEPAEDEGGGKPDKADKANKGNKTPEVPITLRGTVAMATDAKGRSTFSMVSGGTTYELGAGPAWFWGTNNPLAKFAGKTVTITGETHVGATDVDVLTVDGAAIRAAGKPPWAGGWKVVGEKHPGWSQAKADKHKAKFGDCWPPGHCKRAAETTPNTGPLGD